MAHVSGSYCCRPKRKTLEEVKVKRQTMKANIASMEFDLRFAKRALDILENEISEREGMHKKYYEEAK